MDSRMRCSSSLIGPVRAVMRCGTIRSSSCYGWSSGPDFAVAQDDPLEGREALDADRPAGVELVGADADLGAQPVFETVGKARAGVDHHAGRVHLAQEALRMPV